MANVFKQKGLIQILLPREQVRNLQVIQKLDDARGEIIGSIEELFSDSAIGLPLDSPTEKVNDFALENTVVLNASAGIALLETLADTFGKASFDYQWKASDSVSVTYKHILRDRIKSEIILNNFIRMSIRTLKETDTYFNSLINKQLYIITAVYKSDDFSITVRDGASNDLRTQFSLKSLIEISLQRQKEMKVTENQFNQGVLMAFAIRAKRIVYKPGNVFLKPYFGLEDPDIITVLGDEKMHPLSNEHDFFHLKLK